MQTIKLLAVIPARGGSKGIKGKNIKMLGQKPLIQYTLEVAQKSLYIDKIMVSTDSIEISKFCNEFGVEVPSLRPAYLASDESPTVDTILYLIDQFEKENIKIENIILLQPTTPFRTAEFVDMAITKYFDQGVDSLVSVLRVPDKYNPFWVYQQEPNHNLINLVMKGETVIPRRQDLPISFIRSGEIYIFNANMCKNTKSLYGQKIGYIESSNKNYVNIDTKEDWKEAENIINSTYE